MKDREAWHAVVHGVAESGMTLQLNSNNNFLSPRPRQAFSMAAVTNASNEDAVFLGPSEMWILDAVIVFC